MISEIFEKILGGKSEIDEQGIYYNGDMFTLKIDNSDSQVEMGLKISSEKSMLFKAINEIIKDYKEEDEEKVINIYKALLNKYGKQIIKVCEQFDKELSKEINSLKKDMLKL